MKVLAIETSCDETAICIAESNGNKEDLIKVKILGNSLISQVNEHAKYGGVYPTLAVREHKKKTSALFCLMYYNLQECLKKKKTIHR